MKNIILIPYRNREEHLKYWIENTYPKLNKVLENLEVLIIEQSQDDKLFNRGKVLNVGFKYYDKDEYNYFTHDVDHNPINLLVYNNEVNNSIISLKSGHNKSLGGIIKFKGNTFKKINGFRNDYWGWGIEDRDLYYRSKFYNINIIRNHKTKFKVLKHKHLGSQMNEIKSIKCNNIFNNNNNKEIIIKFILNSGLNNLKYKIIKEENIRNNIKKILINI